MYEKHKKRISLICLFTGIVSYIAQFQYSVIASDVISVISIASAVYLAAYAGIQASPKLLEELKKPDPVKKDKSQLFVINTYIKNALGLGLITIAVSCLAMLVASRDTQIEWDVFGIVLEHIGLMVSQKRVILPSLMGICNAVHVLISFAGIVLFAANLSFMWIIGLFVVNRMAYSK